MKDTERGIEICPFCGNQLKNHASFCGKCGKRIPRCPKCGVIISSSNIKYCRLDGTKIPQETLALLQKKEGISAKTEKDEKKSNVKKRKNRKGNRWLIVLAAVLACAGLIAGLLFVNRDRLLTLVEEMKEQVSETDNSSEKMEKGVESDSADSVLEDRTQESKDKEEESSRAEESLKEHEESSEENEPEIREESLAEKDAREIEESVTAVPEETITVAGGYEAPKSDFIFWFSSERAIEISELYRMTPTGTKDVDIASMSEEDKQIRLNYSQVAIDEIYARHGMTVADSDNPSPADLYAREYLNSLEWYRKANSYYLSGNKTELTSIEKDNITLLYHWQHQYWDEENYKSPYVW